MNGLIFQSRLVKKQRRFCPPYLIEIRLQGINTIQASQIIACSYRNSYRLGMSECPDGPIRQHSFFRGIDWKKYESRQIPPPYKPLVKASNDTSNFDDDFTQERPVLTPIQDKTLLASIDPEAFANFSYTNHNFLPI